MTSSRLSDSKGSLHTRRWQLFARRISAAVLVGGGLMICMTASAFGAPTMTVTPSAGLIGGKTVAVSAAGLAKSARGFVLECNMAPGEPTEVIGPPFDLAEPVGCSPPSLKRVVSTTANGTLATVVVVHEGRKLGPPCGFPPIIGGCGGNDSAGKRPRKDAQNYPCPPSPSQQAAGVTCALVWMDTAKDQVSAPIAFLGPPTPVPPTTTVPPGVPSTVPQGSPTPPHTTPPGTGSPTGSGSGGTGSSAGGASGAPTIAPTASSGSPNAAASAAPATKAAGSGTPASAGTVPANSHSLAFTGLGTAGKVLAVVGGVLVLFGILLFLDVRRLAGWLLGLR